MTAVAFVGDRLASGSADATVQLWQVIPNPGPILAGGKALTVPLSRLAFTPDGRPLGVTSWGGGVLRWDLRTGQPRGAVGETAPGYPLTFAVDPGGKSLAMTTPQYLDSKTKQSVKGAVSVWDLRTGKLVRSFPEHAGHGSHLCWSGRGDRLAGAAGTSAWVWEIPGGRLVARPRGDSDIVRLASSPDGELLAAACHDDTIRLWDLASGREVARLAGHGGRILCLAFSADGKRLASGSHDETVRVWDLAGRGAVRLLKGHGGRVNAVCFSPDGRRLVSFGADRAVKIWDLHTGQEVLSLPGYSAAAGDLAFSPDGKHLALFTQDGTAAVWDSEPPPR